MSTRHVSARLRHTAKVLFPVALTFQLNLATAADLSYLRSLLDATPVGGWVQANTSLYGDTKATGASALPDQSFTNPASVVRPWSSMAWDATRGQLYLWGGGHQNYIGNEMRVWSGTTGAWSLGSLPSRIEQVTTAADPRTWVVVDGAAPQSAHTYDGNLYLPVNDYFITFGDAVFNTGGGFQKLNAQGQLVKAGPWLWDPRKADANKVGGTTGSGYDPTVAGGQMWLDRQNQSTGFTGPANSLFTNNSTAYRTENGRDAIYVTRQGFSSGSPDLWRYTLGDVRNGGQDTWEKVGISWNVLSGESTAVIDQAHNLYVQTSITSDPSRYELRVWDLAKAGPDNRDIGVHLVTAGGQELRLQVGAGTAYDDKDGSIWMWDGALGGTLWRTKATYNPDGTLASQWVAERIDSVTAAQPNGNFLTGVFGKWQYISELGAFVALDEYNFNTGDAGVWLYKASASVSQPVPEAGTLAMMLAGLGVVGMLGARRRRTA